MTLGPDLDLAHLRALAAAVDEGSLDGAARRLHVTPSAVSQRLKALETAAGRVLLVRSRPVRPTASGEALLRLARQVELLTADAAALLEGTGPGRAPVVPVAVNADSLSTWVLPALAPLAGELCLELHREDQARTGDLLRSGAVMAAVTSEAAPVPGCSVERLGAMRYRPRAARSFAERWFPEGATPAALAAAPVVVFDRDDRLQHDYLHRRARGREVPRPPQHRVPASADFLEAVRLGYGWGMLPDLQLGAADGGLVVLDPRGAVDVALHWQQWKLRSPALDRVAAAVLAAGREHLHRPR
ncbi:LysR family transcriptional regulator ArgP [Vallicoccus soli]|uniref:LysR family transcriptional regulator ArgP n=1 Tax=Vallicoccus soli TaxID=2339232 RepID=A0A3A3YWH7_9ACTN|nr:LysR family transcriptional regulator ArgP [Vallicoccus soli]RJK95958.1 LysR family transcriptional regulator ArgP [Vallicoccus soli]